MSNTDRIAALSEKLQRASEARDMATTPIWTEAWEEIERELLERLLRCGPDDDIPRYRLQIGIEAARQVRRVIEHQGQTKQSLEKELEVLTGRKPAPIA